MLDREITRLLVRDGRDETPPVIGPVGRLVGIVLVGLMIVGWFS